MKLRYHVLPDGSFHECHFCSTRSESDRLPDGVIPELPQNGLDPVRFGTQMQDGHELAYNGLTVQDLYDMNGIHSQADKLDRLAYAQMSLDKSFNQISDISNRLSSFFHDRKS